MPLDTSPPYIRVIPAPALAPLDLAAWTAIQEADPSLASPYFRPEFTTAVAAVRHDVRVAVIERGGVPAGFFSYQRGWLDIGTPVGGPLSDYQGMIAKGDLVWNAERLIR